MEVLSKILVLSGFLLAMAGLLIWSRPPRVVQYILVTEDNTHDLMRVVNNLCLDGWEPLGPPSIVIGNQECAIHQAMKRKVWLNKNESFNPVETLKANDREDSKDAGNH